MSLQRTGTRLVLTLAVCAALGACATQPRRAQPSPAIVTALPPVPQPAFLQPVTPPAAPDQPWASIVAHDVMPDCSDSRLVRANAAMYTRWPAGFEARLRTALPLIIYVQKQLQANGIPGEFAMLPMLESSYNPAQRTRHGGAAGMWQFMPATARRHGVPINRGYDGRLDPVASTQAAVKMLKKLHREFDDWRLVAMAYNTGPYTISNLVRRHPDLGGNAIPDLPVSASTRTHLARMMALSCIVRDPSKFNVSLPQPSAADELAAVKVPAGTRLAKAANMAEVSTSALRALNPGFLDGRVATDSPRTLLLPANAAESLAAAMSIDASEAVAQVNPPEPGRDGDSDVPLPLEPVLAQDEADADAPSASPREHRVRKGDTLWSIAHHYHVSVRELRNWNDLRGNDVRIGEELRIHG